MGHALVMTSTRTAAAVLFDVDGTLVDTNYLHTVCWGEALRQHGHDVPHALIHRAVGMAGDQLLDHLLGEGRDRDADDSISAARLTLYRTYWGRLTPLPGAVELLRACHERGAQVVLASSAAGEELDALRSALDADDAIDLATTSDDAESGKPAPDIVQTALDKAGVAPDRAVLIGDSVWDGHAAARAGVGFIALESGGTSADELRRAHAVEVHTDAAELHHRLGQSRLMALLTGAELPGAGA